MIAFTTALYQKAIADSALTALIGDRFYEVMAPQNAGLPYAVYSVISNVNSPTFTEKLESVRVQFSVVSRENSSTETLNTMAAFEKIFDDLTKLDTGSTGRIESFTRITKFYDKAYTEAGDQEWNGYVDYDVLYQIF